MKNKIVSDTKEPRHGFLATSPKTAIEMKEITTKVREENSSINRIMPLIELEARRGKREVTFDFKSSDEWGICKQLRNLGYSIRIQNFMNGDKMTDKMTVSW